MTNFCKVGFHFLSRWAPVWGEEVFRRDRMSNDLTTVLNCSSGQLRELDTVLDSVEDVGALQRLNCDRNQLTGLHGLENATALQELHCWGNQLASLCGLENATALQELYCSHNRLTSLRGLENTASLAYIQCNSNQLAAFHGLENATALESLQCDASLGVNVEQWKKARRQILRTICKIVAHFHCMLPLYATLEITEYCAHARHFSEHWRMQKINALQQSVRE